MGPAIALFVQTAIFWIRHHSIDETEYMTYADQDGDETTTISPLKGDDHSGSEKAAL